MLGNWNDFSSDWLGCGVHEHGPECLCDVKITNPTPTVRDCVNDIWMGKEICDIRGYGKPWTSAKFAEYLTDLGQFQDSLRAHGMGGTGLSQQQFDTTFAGMTNLRNAVRDMLGRMPVPSLPMALQLLGITPARFLTAMTQANFPNASAWTIEKIEQLERDTLAHTKIAKIMETYGISEPTYYRIKKYMQPVFDYHGVSYVESASPQRRAARQAILQLIEQGKDNAWIINKVNEEHGVKYTTAAISKMRVRNFPNSI